MKKIIFIIFQFIITLSGYTQIPKESVSMLSPNAASLGVYGEIPVSLFTGIPQIEIPLYEIKTAGHSIPITLCYHGGGVRPDQHPGWTGIGWNITAGGCISRVVKDRIDEQYNPNDAQEGPYNRIGVDMGYLYRCGKVTDKEDWNTYENVSYQAKNYSNQIDTEPDKFSFNFCGYSGEFYLNEKGEWIVKCDKEIKVVFENTDKNFTQIYGNYLPQTAGTTFEWQGASHNFKKFTLITEDGTEYTFGGSDEAIEFSISFFYQRSSRFIANTWNLTKIKYTNGEEVVFIYDTHLYFTAQMYYSLYYISYLYSEASKFEHFYYPDSEDLKSGYQGQLIIPSYLIRIGHSNGYINFTKSSAKDLAYDFDRINEMYYDFYKKNNNLAGLLPILQNNRYNGYPECLRALSWFKLDKMQIYNSTGHGITSFVFKYLENINTRLMLTSVTEATWNKKNKKYQFEYNNPDSLPRYVTNQTDHWGFYNKRYAWVTDESMYPKYKEPNESVCKFGTLEKIIYPTGGYTRFEFEQNDYMKQVSENRTSCIPLTSVRKAGGIRIKEIINSSTGNAADEKSVKKYFYVSDYLTNKDLSSKSSGILGTNHLYGFNNYTVRNISHPSKIIMQAFSSQSVLPGTENSCGNHIGYSEVVEKYPDGSFSIYKFTNFDDGNTDETCDAYLQLTTTIYQPYSSKSQGRGLLKEKTDYNKTGEIKSKRIIDYEKDNDDYNHNYVRAIKALVGSFNPDKNGKYIDQYLEGTAYRIYTYLMRKRKETIYTYENGSSVPNTTKIDYWYNPDKLISGICRTDHNGDEYFTIYKYPVSFSDNISKSLSIKHILNRLIEKEESIIKNSVYIELNKLKLEYNPANLQPENYYISTHGSEYRKKGSYRYDSHHNIIYTIEDGINQTVYLWGYNFQYLIAEIKNASLDDVKSTIGDMETYSGAKTPDFSKLDKLRINLPNAYVTTYKHIPLVGLVAKTEPNGISTYFTYDDFERLIQIKDNYGSIIENYKYKYKYTE
jgi:hypothetical protein